MNRVLITGAAGFIARHAVAAAAGALEVHAVDLRPGPAMKNVFWHSTNLLDANQVDELVKQVRPTHLLHFAWYAEHGKFWNSPLNLDWAAASISLFKSFVAAGGKRAVFAGSCAEYDWSAGAPFVEDQTPSNPRTLYGICKNATRQVVLGYANGVNVFAAWGRIFFLYGPDEHPDRLVPSILNPLLAGKPASCRSGDHVRDLLHVEDVASAFVGLLESEVTGTVNIASGRRVTLGEAARKIAEIAQRPELLRVERQPATPDNPAILLGDNGRLTREVGWHPRYDLGLGLEQVVALKRQSAQP